MSIGRGQGQRAAQALRGKLANRATLGKLASLVAPGNRATLASLATHRWVLGI